MSISEKKKGLIRHPFSLKSNPSLRRTVSYRIRIRHAPPCDSTQGRFYVSFTVQSIKRADGGTSRTYGSTTGAQLDSLLRSPYRLDTSHRYLPYCMEKPSEIAV